MGLLERLGLRKSALAAATGSTAPPSPDAASFDIDLARVRRLASLIPGPLPVALNGLRFAASIRPRKLVIEGGDEAPVTMPRTVYQLVYPDGTIMLDAAMDKATHDSFSPDKPEPYDTEAFATIQRALDAARMIVLTHFHADHAAGVITSPRFAVADAVLDQRRLAEQEEIDAAAAITAQGCSIETLTPGEQDAFRAAIHSFKTSALIQYDSSLVALAR